MRLHLGSRISASVNRIIGPCRDVKLPLAVEAKRPASRMGIFRQQLEVKRKCCRAP